MHQGASRAVDYSVRQWQWSEWLAQHLGTRLRAVPGHGTGTGNRSAAAGKTAGCER